MSWAVGFDNNWKRDVGYGVPAVCDYPECETQIDRGLAFVCGGAAYGGWFGCGLFFCEKHLRYGESLNERVCERCEVDDDPFTPKSDVPEWLAHKLKDPSWSIWREENPKAVAETVKQLEALNRRQK